MVDSPRAEATAHVVFERIWREGDLAAPELIPLPAGEVSVFTSRSPDKDGPNEDCVLVLAFDDGRAVLAVADGIGGRSAGERASAAALEELAAAVVDAAGRQRELREGILDGFDRAHQRVTALAGNGGTTLIAIAIENGEARPFHVGDAAALVTGQRGRLKHATISHSPVGYAVEAGLLDEEEAIVHEDRHLISNAIGIGAMKIELGPVVPLAHHDTLVLGSDGLFDNLRTEEVVQLIRKDRLARAAERLAAAARDRMGTADPEHPSKPDDLTFVVFRPMRRPQAA